MNKFITRIEKDRAALKKRINEFDKIQTICCEFAKLIEHLTFDVMLSWATDNTISDVSFKLWANNVYVDIYFEDGEHNAMVYSRDHTKDACFNMDDEQERSEMYQYVLSETAQKTRR